MEELCAHTQMRVNTADELLFVYTFNDDCVLLLIIGRVVEFDRLESGALKDCLSRSMAVLDVLYMLSIDVLCWRG